MSKYTAAKRPWRLKYFEVYHSRTDALKREWSNDAKKVILIAIGKNKERNDNSLPIEIRDSRSGAFIA